MAKAKHWVEKLREAGFNDTRLAADLGFAHPSAIHRRIKGEVAWTVEDAMMIEHLYGRIVMAREVVPHFFSRLKNARPSSHNN